MEDELDKLGRITVPKASEEARARALAAAMTAFEEAEKNLAAPQGKAEGQRQSSIATKLWSLFMSRKMMLASSALATLLVIPAAGYVTYNLVQDGTIVLVAPKDDKVSDKPADTPVTKPVVEKDTAANDTRLREETSKVDAKPKNAVAETEADGRLLSNKSDAKAEPRTADQAETTGGEVDALAGGTVERKKAEAPQDALSTRTDQDAAADMEVATDEVVPDAVAPAEVFEMAKPMTAQPSAAAKQTMAIGTIAQEGVMPEPRLQLPVDSGDRFTSKDTNPVKSVATEPVSTFSIDVDTASYAYARQAIMTGHLPEPDSVRIEEMINYFPYDWRGPDKAEDAFRANVTVMPTPWNQHTKLMHVAIKGFDVQQAQQPPANLVFLIDVSGSMDEPNKLPLLKSAFRLLVNTLKPADTVSIVVYAGNSGVVLEPTPASDRQKILDAIDNLTPGGSTAGAEGIEAAYRLAEKAFRKDGVNRIMLATDGDFNVGPSSDEDLKSLIEAKRKSGIFLSVLGFGTGNYNDGLMQTLAQNGNGVAAYIDTLSEAQKTLVQEATSSLFPIAKDVKIQVEFNPAKIAEYRLIGYETRALKREDFNNDKVDAGEIGSGHRVTAIYEVTPVGSPAVLNDTLRYAAKDKAAETPETRPADTADELAFVKIRYKKPSEDTSTLITMPVRASEEKPTVDAASADVRFSVAVAAFAQKLKGEAQVSDYGWDAIAALGLAAKGEDRFGYRAEFLKMVDLAKSLKGE
jgi:Ca-activated chloride channel family protein